MTNILIIHSASDITIELEQLFNDLEFQIWTAEPDTDTSKIFQKNNIALVIYYLPTLANIGQEANLSLPESTPVIAISKNYSLEECTTSFPGCPTVDYIQLPLDTERLRAKIDLLLRFRENILELKKAREEIASLKENIQSLKRSIDGHSSFLDLMSRRDGLTGLFNRRYFNIVSKEIFDEAVTSSNELSLAMLNVDLFSEINRSCSQEFGDFVLNELSARITKLSRENDLCFRLSGEEFAIIMPATSAEGALQIAERLRNCCEEKIFENIQFSRKVTLSAGIASLQKHLPRSHEELASMADQALFIAKSEGRNRSVLYVPIDRDRLGTSDKNFKILQDTIHRILGKTKTATVRSLQLLTQGIMEDEESARVQKTQEYAELLGQQLGFTPTLIDTFKNAITLLSSIRYLLHNEMISKKGKLSEEEWNILTDFPYKASQLVELFDYFSKEKTILLCHGERYDGKGYPEGLQGEQIPVGARIFHLASSFAAMNCNRPYRPKLSPKETLAELAKNAGTQFDPFLVMKLIDVIEEKGILAVSTEELENTRQNVLQTISP
jgi:diguanylate cyclase (GGDEF)-like protein